MSDRPNGAASAAPGAIPTATGHEHTEREVAGILAGLLDDDDGPEPPPRPGREPRREPPPDSAPDREPGDSDDTESEPDEGDDAAADDSPPSSEDEPEGEDEADALVAGPPLDPPAGWNAEDRRAWSQLPPAVQDTIRRRDSEMAARLTRGTQEMAERERVWTTQLETVNADRAQYVQNLEVFKRVLVPEAEALAQVDMARLSTENPAEYIRLAHIKDAVRDRLGWIQGEVQRIQQVQQYEHQQRVTEARKRGHERLVAAMPEFADPETANRLGTQLGAFLRKKGYADWEIEGVHDDRAIKLAMELMRFEDQQTAVQRADAKRTPRPAPQVQRPGSSRRVDGNGSQQHRMTQLASRFDKNGRTVKDAASILAEWMP